MTSPNFSVSFSATMAGAAGAIAAGYGVCQDSSGQYVVATSANLALYGRFGGIAVTDASLANLGFAVQYVGEIPSAVTGLGAGTRSAVILDATGKMARSATPNYSSDIVVGDCDVNGNVTLTNISRVSPPAGGGGSAPSGTGIAHVSGGAFVSPAAAVALGSSDVSGTLPVARGGTNRSALGTARGLPEDVL